MLLQRCRKSGFTLIELLVVMAVIAIMGALLMPTVTSTMDSAKAAKSTSNIQQLVIANLAYAAENDGYFCPAQSANNRIRWHGARSSSTGPFDPTKGYLSPYLGNEGRVKMCPLFSEMLGGSSSFEEGTGGYGYNATYIGGTPSNWGSPSCISRVPHPSKTVMFTTTAFAKSKGVQEYPYSEPYEWVDPNNNLSGALQPSVHFRFRGKALVAWCDGRVSQELPSKLGGTEYYGGDSVREKIGWFGPSEQNGYWNPDYTGP